MGDDSAGAGPARYRAFISYSHADAKFAGWLHRRLEGWRLPDRSRLAPIFIDRAELAAGADLSAQVRTALGESAALVVVASPRSRASRWVRQEIALFRELHPTAPVLAALIEGEPDSAFPEELCEQRGQRVEPLAADFRDGQDGRRLALIKIVAGLTGLPLDRLVQRDAQARQRRVMAITAGVFILSLVLAALLVFALRARAEAERQRAEAEGLVEFMLTDLRDKLKGVGRLDVMDAVNERAMSHYAGVDLARLPSDEALRRARLLQSMGADDLDRAGVDPDKAAIRRRAEQELGEAWRLTGALLNESPGEPERIFAHAQSEFYLGLIAFTPPAGGQRDIAKSRQHWEGYLRLAQQLVRGDPANQQWIREVGFAQGSLCSLGLQANANPDGTLKACNAASASMDSIYRTSPDALLPGIELANRLGWEADAALAAGQADQAVALRRRQVSIASQLARAFSRDARALKAEMLAQLGAARLLQKLGKPQEAVIAADRALQLINTLSDRDPANADWQARKRQVAAIKDVVLKSTS